MSPKRPIIRYHGGKWRLAPWIISHFPDHRVYTETYGGAASVLLRKPRSYAEIYNDLDGEVVNLFKVTRDCGGELLDKLYHTPFARQEFVSSYEPSDDPIEQARRTVIRAFMGFGSSAVTRCRHRTKRFNSPNTGFRANSNRSGTTPAHDWKNYADCFDLLIERLRGVIVENRPALEIMATHDSDTTLHYVDPPYVSDTRDKGADYAHEMNDADHIELANFLRGVKGMVVLSGYKSVLYDELYGDWHRIDCQAMADGASPRTESLWISPNANLQGRLEV